MYIIITTHTISNCKKTFKRLIVTYLVGNVQNVYYKYACQCVYCLCIVTCLWNLFSMIIIILYLKKECCQLLINNFLVRSLLKSWNSFQIELHIHKNQNKIYVTWITRKPVVLRYVIVYNIILWNNEHSRSFSELLQATTACSIISHTRSATLHNVLYAVPNVFIINY